MFSTLYGTYFPFWMHFKMLSAICFNLDQSKILLSVNGLNMVLANVTTNTSLQFLSHIANYNIIFFQREWPLFHKQ